jgi:hypothetical protein
VFDSFSVSAGAYALALGAWAAAGLAYLSGVSGAWLVVFVLVLVSLQAAFRAWGEGEIGIPAAAGPFASGAAVLYLTVPDSLRVFVFGVGLVCLAFRLPRRGPQIPLPFSHATGAFILGACAWACVGLFFLLTDSSGEESQGCDLIDCFGGLGDEIFWWVTLAPVFFVTALAGVGVAARGIHVYGWSLANLGAMAFAGSGPLVYLWLSQMA